MLKRTTCIAALLFASLAVASGNAFAAEKERPKLLPITPVGPGLQLSRLFNDHMVLQREIPVKIWGGPNRARQSRSNSRGRRRTPRLTLQVGGS